MAFLTPYSARNVFVGYAGVLLNSGRPEDVFFTVAWNAPRTAMRKGLSGDTSASISPDHSAIVTLSFYPESLTAKVLGGMYTTMKVAESKGLAILGAAPLVIKDPTGSMFLTCREAVIQNQTDMSFGADTGTISFEFFVEEALIAPLPGLVADQVIKGGEKLGLTGEYLNNLVDDAAGIL